MTRKATTAGFLLAVVLLAFVGAWMYRATTALVRSEVQVARSEEVLRTLGAGFLFDLTDAQSGRRGFIMNGDAYELDRYQTAVARIGADLAELERLTDENPNQRRRVQMLKPLVTKRLALWEQSVAVRKEKGFQIERERELMLAGRELNQALRRLVGDMQGEENALLQRRQERARVSVRRALLVLAAGTLLSTAVLSAVFVLLRREISQRVRAEKELRLRTAQLETANKELEAFSYSVSHDLRNPLGVVSGFSDILLEEYADKLDETGSGYLRRVGVVTRQMAQLIDDLLQFSLVQRTDLKREPVDLSALAEAVAGELREAEPDREVTFVIAQGLSVMADRELLRVVLRNLLGNAWKFTRKQSQARVELGAVEQDGAVAYFVRDNGVGFDMADANKVFETFSRLRNAREFGGTGIGLATVRRIIQRHTGRVWAEAAAGEGATVYFTL